MFTLKTNGNDVYCTIEDGKLRLTDGNSFWYYIDGWTWF